MRSWPPHSKLPPRSLQISQNVARLRCVHACVSVLLSIHPHVCSLLYSLFASSLSLSFRCLPFITGWIPKCKMSAERETERAVYIFNGELLYFHKSSFPLPSFGSSRRGRWDRWRRKIINKLQINECGTFELRQQRCHAHSAGFRTADWQYQLTVWVSLLPICCFFC